jgi:hypothetical protein
MHKAEALIAVDDEGRRPSNIESGEPEAMVHTIALDYRSIRIDKDWQGERSGTVILGHFLRTLADDHQDFSAKVLIGQ